MPNVPQEPHRGQRLQGTPLGGLDGVGSDVSSQTMTPGARTISFARGPRAATGLVVTRRDNGRYSRIAGRAPGP